MWQFTEPRRKERRKAGASDKRLLRGQDHPNAKYTDAQVRSVRREVAHMRKLRAILQRYTYAAIAKRHNMSASRVADIARFDAWTHLDDFEDE